MRHKSIHTRIIPTKRNKALEPRFIRGGVLGYDPEIHDEDSVEFTYKLPLGAIKRLIKSYYEDIQSIDSASVYMATSGSSEIRMHPYCYRMIADLRKQLDKHGLNGKKICDEVFDQYFKADYENMRRFQKNHGSDVLETFEPCKDPECCNYTTNLFHKILIFWKLFKDALRGLRYKYVSNKPPRIIWSD